MKRKLCNRNLPGPPSPMKPTENIITSMTIQKAIMGQPMSIGEGVAFANSLIEGTIH